MITREEFIKAAPPLYFIRVENFKFSPVQIDLIAHWINAHCGGWVYYDQHKTYVFERLGDRLMFKIWISGDPFANPEGEILDDKH